MFNSAALEVVTGLIFIYLLYSLLATIISEMIASILGLRARHLEAAIRLMLGDGNVSGFYDTPEIRLLGGAGKSGKPSSIRPESFSKALLSQLSGEGPASADKISAVLRLSAANNGPAAAPAGFAGAGTAGYLLELWEEAGADVGKFRKMLESWFDKSMEQATEWYKRRIQMVLLVIGFLMAWVFCADTFFIVNKLSTDHVAREQISALSASFMASTPVLGDTVTPAIRKKVEEGLAGAGSVLGLGSWLPATVKVSLDPVTRVKTYEPRLDPECLNDTARKISNGTIRLSPGERAAYFLRLVWHHFFGFLITAIAVSLGAPFWFDLLNRIMKLRTSFKAK